MSEVISIVNNIKNQFKCSEFLKFVRKFETYEDENKLVLDGKFPWVNISIYQTNITNAGNLRRYDAERHEYSLVITFSNRSKSKRKVLKGNEDVKGIWAFYENIMKAINQDKTFNNKINEAPLSPDVATDAIEYENGKFWIGRGAVKITIYKDYNLRG